MGKKRKRATPLPNGYGSVRYIDKRHSKPFGVYPAALWDESTGRYIRPGHAICFCKFRETGIACLSAYNAGTYTPGMEEQLDEAMAGKSRSELKAFDELTAAMLSDYREFKRKFASAARLEALSDDGGATFAEVFTMFMQWKYEESPKQHAEGTKNNEQTAYRISSPLHGKVFKSITLDELQAVINGSSLKHGTLAKAKSLWGQMYKFAIPRNLCSQNLAEFVVVPSADDVEHGTAFTPEEIKSIWDHRYTDETAELLVTMIYSGFRISAYSSLEIHLDESSYFKGGVKTKAGKDRIVPIHPCIADIVRIRLERDGALLDSTPSAFVYHMKKYLRSIGLDDSHTPHDCRHTFSALCERYHVSEADRKRMMGHSFGSDLTNGVYGHRTLEDLAREIAKIPDPEHL